MTRFNAWALQVRSSSCRRIRFVSNDERVHHYQIGERRSAACASTKRFTSSPSTSTANGSSSTFPGPSPRTARPARCPSPRACWRGCGPSGCHRSGRRAPSGHRPARPAGQGRLPRPLPSARRPLPQPAPRRDQERSSRHLPSTHPRPKAGPVPRENLERPTPTRRPGQDRAALPRPLRPAQHVLVEAPARLRLERRCPRLLDRQRQRQDRRDGAPPARVDPALAAPRPAQGLATDPALRVPQSRRRQDPPEGPGDARRVQRTVAAASRARALRLPALRRRTHLPARHRPPSASRAARRARSPPSHDPDPTPRPAGTAERRALGTCGREVRELAYFEASRPRSSGKRPPRRCRPARLRANRRAIRSAAPAEAIASRSGAVSSRQVVDPETRIETARAVANAPARPAWACPTTDRFGAIARTYLWGYPRFTGSRGPERPSPHFWRRPPREVSKAGPPAPSGYHAPPPRTLGSADWVRRGGGHSPDPYCRGRWGFRDQAGIRPGSSRDQAGAGPAHAALRSRATSTPWMISSRAGIRSGKSSFSAWRKGLPLVTR